MQIDFKLYKVDMKYIRNLHNIDDKVLSVLPQAGKDNRIFVGIVIICGAHKYCMLEDSFGMGSHITMQSDLFKWRR